MPHHKSCMKRVRTSAKQNQKNRMATSKMKTLIKKVSTADDKDAALKDAYSIIDRNVKAGVIHKNNAATKKSRLSKAIKKAAA